MDAGDDKDLYVQSNSAELLAELLDCIPLLIYQGVRAGSALQPRSSLSGAALSHITRLVPPSLSTIIRAQKLMNDSLIYFRSILNCWIQVWMLLLGL